MSKSPLAAKQVTNRLPIVMVEVVAPVGRGLIANRAHPSGNVTGPMLPGEEIAGKYVRLLTEVVPPRSCVEPKSLRTTGIA